MGLGGGEIISPILFKGEYGMFDITYDSSLALMSGGWLAGGLLIVAGMLGIVFTRKSSK